MFNLHNEQKNSWDLCRKGYKSLDTLSTKHIKLNDYKVIVQYNPGRIRNSTALVDDASVGKRKCFLCPNNRSPYQKGIMCLGEFVILVNPAPIFPHHFTISHKEHISQYITSYFEKLLILLHPIFL